MTLCFIQIYWLPVRYRIQYKLCALMHNARSWRAPCYLSDIVQSISARTTRTGLRSSSAAAASYVSPRLRTTFGERAFSFSGLTIWNSFPADLCSISDNADLKKTVENSFLLIGF